MPVMTDYGWEPDEDYECPQCEEAAKDYEELEKVVGNLSALVARLVREVRKATPDNDLANKAMDYLKREGLQGSPLREELELKGME